MALTTKVAVAVTAAQQSDLDLAGRVANHVLSATLTLPSGTASGKADVVFSDSRDLASGASENLDLAGTLVDAFGATVTFAKVKGILIKAAAANTVNITVGGAASNAFVGPFGASTHTITIPPGDVWLSTATSAGWSVTAGTADLIKVLAGAAAATYQVVIWGTSA